MTLDEGLDDYWGLVPPLQCRKLAKGSIRLWREEAKLVETSKPALSNL